MNEKLGTRVVRAIEEMLKEIQEHNLDYHHHTPQTKIKEWMDLAEEITAL